MGAPFWKDRATLHQLADLAREAGAPRASLKLTMAHQKGSMHTGFIKRASQFLWAAAGMQGEHRNVGKIKITGSNDSDEPIVVDLLKDRLEEFVECATTDRRLLYPQRRAAVKAAFELHRQSLTEQYGT